MFGGKFYRRDYSEKIRLFRVFSEKIIGLKCNLKCNFQLIFTHKITLWRYRKTMQEIYSPAYKRPDSKVETGHNC